MSDLLVLIIAIASFATVLALTARTYRNVRRAEDALKAARPDVPPSRGVDAAKADAWDEGIRQAVVWLRADYEFGTGPDWREQGAEWIEERAAEARIARMTPTAPDG